MTLPKDKLRKVLTPARKQSRSELLRLVRYMADDLEERAANTGIGLSSTQRHIDASACQLAARHLRELMGIAQGQRSAAYWCYRAERRLRLAS